MRAASFTPTLGTISSGGNCAIASIQITAIAPAIRPTASSNDKQAWQQQQPPPPTRLPPNAILIHFSDGSTRVCPPLYHLLLQQDVIHEVNLQDSSLIQDDVEEYKQASRFDDDVFLTLDNDLHKTTTNSTVKQQRNVALEFTRNR